MSDYHDDGAGYDDAAAADFSSGADAGLDQRDLSDLWCSPYAPASVEFF